MNSAVLQNNRHWLILGVVCIGVMALVFSVNGFFDTRIDAPIYAAQITSFTQGAPFAGDAVILQRLFKPLYAIIGGTLFHTTHPYSLLFALNVFFYVLLVGAVFRIFRELSYSVSESVIGATWIATAYPLLKYGLALGTDISGWALSAVTLWIGLVALRKNSYFLLCIASVIGFVGATAKETGVLGLIALCILVVWRLRRKGFKNIIVYTLSAGLPALILYGVLLGIIAGHAPSFLDWFSANNAQYGDAPTHSFFTSMIVEGSTFGLYWLGVLYTSIMMIRFRRTIKNFDVIVVTFVATLPVLFWPVFISRIQFIQFLWVIPLALHAYVLIRDYAGAKTPRYRRTVSVLMVSVPIVVNILLFIISSGGSLFDAFR
jgi:hypothetical protein